MPNQQILFLLLLSFALSHQVLAQNKVYVHETFRGTRVVNGHSVETMNEGELEFLISHRFGPVNGGTYELFGLDQASIRFGLEYGIKKWFNVGFGRSSFGKHYDAFLKVALLRQSDQMPISLVAFSSAAINTLRPNNELPVPIQSRMAYSSQILIAKKFGDKLSLQLMPTYVHYNLVETRQEKNDALALGAAAKVQVSKNLGVTLEYYYPLPNQLADNKHPSLALGFDINTGSHVFQVHLTNSSGMIEKAFVGETTGDWLNGDIKLGFNISRTFKLRGRRY